MILARIEPFGDALFALKTAARCDALYEVLKSTPGMQWNPDHRVWAGYDDAIALVKKRLEGSREVKLVQQQPPLVRSLPIALPQVPLRPSQVAAIEFLKKHSSEGALLADDLGLGKTRSAVGAAFYPAVVVCPNSVKTVWAAEAKVQGFDVQILSGTKADKPLGGFNILNYDIAYAWAERLRGNFDTFILDEVQALSNPKSRRSEACKLISSYAVHKIALSGTPMLNRPRDLWNVIDTISPGRFGGFMKFAIRYCGAFQEEIKIRGGDTKKVWNTKGATNLDELRERLSYFMLRRTKQDVNLELPPKTRQIIELDVGKAPQSRINWETISESAVMNEIRRAAELKIPHAVELATSHTEAGSSVVVFTYTKAVAREIVELLAKNKVPVFLATGDHSAKQREVIAKQAAEAQPSVIVTTLDSMGTGVNYLTYADVMIFAELHYVPTVLYQGEGRLDRPGQRRNVLIQYLIGLGTIDEFIREAVCSKLDTYNQTFGGNGENLEVALMGDKDPLQELAAVIRRMNEEEFGG